MQIAQTRKLSDREKNGYTVVQRNYKKIGGKGKFCTAMPLFAVQNFYQRLFYQLFNRHTSNPNISEQD